MSIRLAALLILPALALIALAPDTSDKKAALGAEMYQSYCASCHGSKGLSDGPVAPYLKSVIPDLTTLTKRNQGTFPGLRVSQVIRGEVDVKTHGVREMAVWGPFFLSQKNSQEAVARTRVANLTTYLESIQAK